MSNSESTVRKLQIVNKCSECKHCVFDGGKKEHWGKHWCWAMNVEVNPDEIPPACPLEDYGVYESKPLKRPVSI